MVAPSIVIMSRARVVDTARSWRSFATKIVNDARERAKNANNRSKSRCKSRSKSYTLNAMLDAYERLPHVSEYVTAWSGELRTDAPNLGALRESTAQLLGIWILHERRQNPAKVHHIDQDFVYLWSQQLVEALVLFRNVDKFYAMVQAVANRMLAHGPYGVPTEEGEVVAVGTYSGPEFIALAYLDLDLSLARVRIGRVSRTARRVITRVATSRKEEP